MLCKETQTEAGLNSKCEECNFEEENERELGWHMGRIHGWPSDISVDPKADQMDISLLSTDPRNCEQCDFEAEDMYDLDAHTWDDSIACDLCDNTYENKCDLMRHIKEEHTQKGETKQKYGLQCKFCEECFESKRELMEHSKKEHTERVSVCWKFTSGQCEYGIEKCWFNHISTERCETKCNFCEQIFPNQSEFLTHRKIYSKVQRMNETK